MFQSFKLVKCKWTMNGSHRSLLNSRYCNHAMPLCYLYLLVQKDAVYNTIIWHCGLVPTWLIIYIIYHRSLMLLLDFSVLHQVKYFLQHWDSSNISYDSEISASHLSICIASYILLIAMICCIQWVLNVATRFQFAASSQLFSAALQIQVIFLVKLQHQSITPINVYTSYIFLIVMIYCIP